MPDVYAPTNLDRERARLAGTLPAAQAPGPGFFASIPLGVTVAGAGPDWGLNQLNYEGHVIGDVTSELRRRGRDSELLQIERDKGSDPQVASGRVNEWEWRANRILGLAAAERARDPSFLPDYAHLRSFGDVTALARTRRNADLAAATSQLQNGSGVGQFVGELAHGFVDPINYLPIGGPTGGVAVSFGRRVLTSALWAGGANAAIAAGEAPLTYQDAKGLGIHQTAGDIATNVGLAGAFGFGLGGGHGTLSGIAETFRAKVPEAARTPTEDAALHVLDRQAEVQASSPFISTPVGDDAHVSALGAAMRAHDAPPPIDVAPAPVPLRAPPRVSEAALLSGEPTPAPLRAPAREIVKARIRQAESGGNDHAVNPQSSASGRYNFTYNTWLGYYRRRYGGSEAAQTIWGKRFDTNLQEVLEDDLLSDAGHALHRAGQPETPGSLYLIHFAGEDRGLHILGADPATPIERIMSADAIARNKFLRGKTAGEVVAWADRKMGGGTTPHAEGGMSPRWREEEPGLVEDPERYAQAPAEPAPEPAEHVQLADYQPHEDGLLLQDRPNLRPDLFATPEQHAAAQLEVWREHDARDGFASVARDARPAAAAGEPGPVIEVAAPSRPRRSGAVDVMQAVADAGGIANTEGHDLLEGRNLPRFIPGAGEIVKAAGKGGRTVDAMGEHLWQQGYFGPPATTPRPTENQVLQLVERAAREKVYRPEEAAVMAERAAQRAAMPEQEARFEITSHAADHGVTLDPATLDAAMAHRAAGETVEGAVGKAVEEARFRDIEPPAGLERFDDPSSPSFADAQITSLEHDFRMAALGGDEGVYEVGPDGAHTTLAEMLDDLDRDEETARTLRECMVPPSVAAE